MKGPCFKKSLPAALFLSIPSLSAQDVVLVDDFTGSLYTSSFLNGQNSDTNFFDISFGGGGVAPSGGNPGATLEVFHFHNLDLDPSGQPFDPSNTTTEVQSFFENSALSYTPSIQGDIQSISFSLDFQTSDPFSSVIFTINDANGGAIAGGGTGFLPITSNGEFQTLTFSGVTAAGASGVDFSGSEPLNFGFGFTSFQDVPNGPVLLEGLADNFRIDIVTIPEPSSALLLSFGFLGLTRRRR